MEEVKLAIKPFYQKREVTKDEYQDILRKAVQKVGVGAAPWSGVPGGGSVLSPADAGSGRCSSPGLCSQAWGNIGVTWPPGAGCVPSP